MVTFTHSHNKCYTIFTKYLFSNVIGHNFILLWNLLCLYSNIYANSYKYLKEKKIQKEDWKRKKKIYSTVATVTIGQIKRYVAITTCLRAWKKLWLYFLFFFLFFFFSALIDCTLLISTFIYRTNNYHLCGATGISSLLGNPSSNLGLVIGHHVKQRTLLTNRSFFGYLKGAAAPNF